MDGWEGGRREREVSSIMPVFKQTFVFCYNNVLASPSTPQDLHFITSSASTFEIFQCGYSSLQLTSHTSNQGIHSAKK